MSIKFTPHATPVELEPLKTDVPFTMSVDVLYNDLADVGKPILSILSHVAAMTQNTGA